MEQSLLKLASKYFSDETLQKEFAKAFKKSYERILAELSSTTGVSTRSRLRALEAELKKQLKEAYAIDVSGEIERIAKPFVNDMDKITGFGMSWTKLPDVAIKAILDPNTIIAFNGMSLATIFKDTEGIHVRKMRNVIAQGLIEGKSVDAIAKMMRDVNTTMLNKDIKTVARTLTAEAMSRSNMEVFERSEQVIGYQYQAKLDNRTTEYCRNTDDKVYYKKDGWTPEELKNKNLWPPVHWNCRSVITPYLG